MLSRKLISRPFERSLLAILVISYIHPSIGQSDSEATRPDSQGIGQLQGSMLNYGLHPSRRLAASDPLEEPRPLEGEETLHAPHSSDKRFNKFVRVGRGGAGTFVRIGKSNNMNDESESLLSQFQRAFPESLSHLPTKRPMNRFIRIGRGFEGYDSDNDVLADIDNADPLFSDFQRTFSGPTSPSNKRYMHRFIRIGRDMEGDDFDDDALEDIDSADSYDRFKKSPSSFVRIGKAPNKFVRIGKSPSSFVRIGKSPSSFVRIGKSPSSFVRIGKSPSSFVRIGKSPSSFVRIGKSPSSFVRIGKSPSSFVRIGKAPNKFVRIGKSPSSFVRIGKSASDEANIFEDKRPSSFVRIGRSAQQVVEPQDASGDDIKRPSSFVRIGKSSAVPSSPEKRPSSFVRIGKSVDETDTQDEASLKRASAFVRIGKSTALDQDSQLIEHAKRPSSFVRIGKSGADALSKRAGNFLRIGRLANLHNEASKRGFVRIGKNDDTFANKKSSTPDTDSKPPSGESLGKEQPKGDAGPINVSSRGSAFVRIGKIPSSAFVRIGKNSEEEIEEEPGRVYSFQRGSRGGQSVFLRIG